jgi:hypothetical protein
LYKAFVLDYLTKFITNSCPGVRFNKGPKCKLSAKCRLAKGNPQRLGVLCSFSGSKMPRFDFLIDLKAQSEYRKRITQFGSEVYKIFKAKNMLEYELKNG